MMSIRPYARKAKKVLKKIIGDNSQVKYQILLLTNRDSDNVGDQTIEACDISLIKIAMNNLGISSKEFKVNSKAGSIISQQYLKTKKPELLETAKKAMETNDVVVFGGAPVFNYLYQNMYERTAVTIELAEKYNVPVLFSAVGVDGYDENNPRCQRITEKINSDSVIQVTTRDNIEALKKYVSNSKIKVEKVADPAVFSKYVFKNFTCKKEKGKIGLFVFRAHGFEDNKIPFTKEDAIKMWLDLSEELKNRGYKVEFLTSGHFGDEAFMDYLIRNAGVKTKDCVFNINKPEDLIGKISSYEGVVSCRLHPSILSFSLDVPSMGIIWNNKVKMFYESIGYADRNVYTDELNIKELVDRLEEAIKQPVKKDKEYMMTVYNTLFEGLNKALGINTKNKPYTFEQLIEKMPKYAGTSKKEIDEKLKRKFRRTYQTLNERDDKIAKLEGKK